MRFSLTQGSQTIKKQPVSGQPGPVGSTTPPVSAVHLLGAALIYSLLMTRIQNKT
jgi:hypothetical protein